MITSLFRYWFTFAERVTPRQYLTHGLALMLTKYLSDAALVRIGADQWWSPIDYMRSVSTLQSSTLSGAASWLMPALAVWTLPFLWAGITLTMRRAIDAGRSPWWSVGFFVPFVNYVTIAALSTLPSRSDLVVRDRALPEPPEQAKYLIAILPGLVFGVLMLALSVYQLRAYGAALFFATPFGVGALTAFSLNRRYLVSGKQSRQVVLLTITLLGALLILFGREGAICIAMAIPLAFVVALMGGEFGRQIAAHAGGDLRPATLGMLAFPLFAIVEPKGASGAVLHEVRSSVEIAASPMTVWSQVIAFPPMPEPTTWFFRLGVAYPKYARIEGSGVGAIRYCVFSTGPFVEPITVWEPGRRLSFDVASSPVPLRELTPFEDVMPPHLKGFLQSRRGEFRLVALPDGRTRLEGSTWYSLAMGPEGYWQMYGDYLIHRIHVRVLEHIKLESERRTVARL
ncbi:MAG: SRPBCC family protein [Gemmatimonadaceae bacterium]|nr:SRPBCC family protein [Gemmatimonadaceae bacterium]